MNEMPLIKFVLGIILSFSLCIEEECEQLMQNSPKSKPEIFVVERLY